MAFWGLELSEKRAANGDGGGELDETSMIVSE